MLSKLWSQYLDHEDYMNRESVDDIPDEDVALASNMERRLSESPVSNTEDAIIKLKFAEFIAEGNNSQEVADLIRSVIDHLDTKKLRTPIAKQSALSLCNNHL